MALRYGTPFSEGYSYGTLVRCLNLPTKRIMRNVRPSMKIRATETGVQCAHSLGCSQVIIIASLIYRCNCIMMSQVTVTSMTNCDVIVIVIR